VSEVADFEVNNGVPLDEQLQFMARSVVVDNFTSSWLYVRAARRYVPPGGGAGLSFPGTQKASIEWRTPPGKTPIPAIPSEAAEVIFSSSSTPEGAGITSQLATSSAPGSPANITQWGGTATTLGQKVMASSLPVVVASDQSAIPILDDAEAAELAVTNTGVAGAAVTLTLPAIGSRFHYISLIQVARYAIAALAGGGAPLLVTTTNLPGAPVLDFASQSTAEGDEVQVLSPAKPIKSGVVGTATTIVCPAVANVIWRATAWYHLAP
jgi:hypothetical protein